MTRIYTDPIIIFHKKHKLSSAQIASIVWAGSVERFFVSFNCWMHASTLKALEKKGILEVWKGEKRYRTLSKLGKEILAEYHQLDKS